MKFTFRTVGLLSVMTASVALADKPVARKSLPPAVEKAVAAETSGATIKNISAEECDVKADGKTCYEVETVVAGKTRDLIIDSSGRVAEVEEEVTVESVSPAVRMSATSGGSIKRIEKVTRDGASTFEVSYAKGSKKASRTFLADGSEKK
ncbi:MAG: hypothetical protein ABI672_18905 [Vicinamibacteria bacterium]